MYRYNQHIAHILGYTKLPKALELLKGLTYGKSIEFLRFHSTTQQQLTLSHKIILGLGT
jgi:hypothetical protein